MGKATNWAISAARRCSKSDGSWNLTISQKFEAPDRDPPAHRRSPPRPADIPAIPPPGAPGAEPFRDRGTDRGADWSLDQGQEIRFTRKLKSALLAAAVVLAAAIAGLAIGLTKGQDRLALDASHLMVDGAFNALENQMQVFVREHAFRDETYEATRSGNTAWLFENIAPRAGSLSDLAVIVEPGQQVDYGWQLDGEARAASPGLVPPPVLAQLHEGLDALPVTSRAAFSTYARIGDGVWLLVISRVAPRDGIAPGTPDPAIPRLVIGKRLSPAALQQISAPFLRDGLRLSETSAVGEARHVLRDARGTVLSYATWTAPRPGWHVLASIGAPVALITLVTIFVLVVAAFHIVGSARRLESALVRAQKANRAKSDFVATVSHELRTPVTSIIGSLDLIASGALAKTPGKEAEILGIARSNSRRLAALIEDLLQIQKMETGKLDYRFEAIPVGAVVERAVQLTRPIAGNAGVEIHLPATIPLLHVRADQSRLEQVLTNILSNAIKFSHPGGDVRIAVEDTPAGVRVSVIDHGLGIPDGARTRVFAPFGQIDSSDTRSAGGTGLGLNIAQRIVAAHHGVIDYHGTPGGGTTFYVELPRVSAPA